LTDEVRQMLRHLPDPPRSRPPEPSSGLFETVGDVAYRSAATSLDALVFSGKVFAAAVRRGGFPIRESAIQAVRIGVDGFPIVGTISYIVGLIIAFQSAWQLQRFGATALVAPMVGFMMVRELGPLMMGILLAGRSGSSVAAELGTMVVQEEEAALRTMGLDPVRFLALPRFIGFMVAGPLLAVMAMVLGVLGGLTIGVAILDLDALTYYHQTVQLLRVGSFFNGMSKAVIYAALVGLISCYNGLSLTGGAMAVGRATTRTVVVSIFSIIVADFIVTMVTIGSLK
jgi:phospholipid/cholesterol/gamma-HCH transport system permease protein